MPVTQQVNVRFGPKELTHVVLCRDKKIAARTKSNQTISRLCRGCGRQVTPPSNRNVMAEFSGESGVIPVAVG